MKISKKACVIEPSLTRQLFNMAQKYDDVVDLTLGDPDVCPSDVIKKAACEAIMMGKTRYSSNAGLIQLRQVIANHIQSEYKIAADPNSEILVTVGGMEALYLALSCIIDEGDEIIIHAPYYVNYVQMIRMCGGVPIIINTSEDNGFILTAESVKEKITSRTVGIVINNPCNPTGEVLDEKTLDELAEIVRQNNLIVISDEVYSSLVFDGKKHHSILTRDNMKDHTILIDSVSKRFAMTGYRLGYVYAPNEIIANMTKMQENVAACAPLPSQYAAIAAYTFSDNDESLKNIFEARRNYIYQAIKDIDGLTCRKPSATFYLFVNISKTGLASLEFAKQLLQTKHVAVAPGITYGKNYDNYIRIAYTLKEEKLREAVKRIKEFMLSLKNSKEHKK